MKPRFILNSFTRQLYSDEDDNKKIIPLIEPHNLIDQCIGYEPNYKGYEVNDDSKEDERDYWSLRQKNSNEKIQRMKDAKIYDEILAVRDKPEMNVKSKKMIEKKYKELDVLKRMKMIDNKTNEKNKRKFQQIENKSKQSKSNTMKINSNRQYSSVQSKYLHNNNQQDIDIIKKNNTLGENNNATFKGNNNPNNNVNANAHDNKKSISNREDTKRKRDLNKLIFFMNQLI